MKKGCGYCHDTGLLILRLLLAAVFLFHVLAKFGAGADMVSFVGGAPYSLGLTFLAPATWFFLAIVGELFIAITLLFGIRTRLMSVVLWIVLFFAMTAKHRSFPMIEYEIVLAVLGVVLFIAGPGKFSMTKSCNSGCAKADHPHKK